MNIIIIILCAVFFIGMLSLVFFISRDLSRESDKHVPEDDKDKSSSK